MPPLIPRAGQTVSSFSYSILFDGKEIGNLQTFTPTQNRTTQRVRSLAVFQGNPGETFEIVPLVSEFTLEVTAFELYSKAVVEFMGYPSFSSIEELLSPIDIMEVMLKPDGNEKRRLYQGCWVTKFGTSGISANGSVITDSVSFAVTKVVAA